jgi:predicted DNA-binding protein YlxM (UPF0122 family)
MEKFIYYNELYLIYKGLLKNEASDIFDLYYGDNLTMQEIADLKKISKARVGVIIKNTCKKLDLYESKLGIYSKNKRLEKLIDNNDINNIKDEIKEILKGE